jgi:hypothetical protein
LRGRALAGFFGLGAVLLGLVIPGPLGAPTANAALEPGTPLAVAPGVPGHGRSWELVTPPDVVSALLYNVRAIAADGDRVSYMTGGPLPGAPTGAPMPAVNVAVRGGSGWVNHPVAAPYPLLGAPGLYPGPLALSPDLSTSIWTNYLPLGAGESESEVGLFHRSSSGAFTLLAEIGASGYFIGASKDTGQVFFTSEAHLLSADANRVQGKSIYAASGSALRLVDVDDEGALLSNCGSTVLADEYGVATDGAISSDGQRVFLSAHPCAGPTRVFLRQEGAATTEISAPQCQLSGCGLAADVSFVGATPSGSSAFLVTEEKLVDGDANSHRDLYRYDVASGALSLLSSGSGGLEVVPGSDAVRVSADGSRVYFCAAPASEPERAPECIYVSERGELRRFASVGSLDLPTFENPVGSLIALSADGRYALLSTAHALAPEDSDERRDLYRYDAATDTTTPISVVGPAGGNGPFDARTRPAYVAETAASQPYRSMSEDGAWIFFNTEERLVPEDRNDATDVYEWADGNLGLISSGAGDRPDVYLGATPDGRTVLFRTTATLLPSDRDGGEMDFYAARVGGGFSEAAAAGGCPGGACASVQTPVHSARPVPRSSLARPNVIALRRPSPAARAHFAASGWVTLLVEAPKSGRLSAVARARVGRRLQTVASTEVELPRAGPAQLRMLLSKEARESLAAGNRLRLRLRLRLSGLPSSRRVSFELVAGP